MVTVTDNAADPHDNFSQSVKLTPDKTIGGCGWKSAAGRLVRAALVVSTYIHLINIFLYIYMHTLYCISQDLREYKAVRKVDGVLLNLTVFREVLLLYMYVCM